MVAIVLKLLVLMLLVALAVAGGAVIRNSVSLIDPPGTAKRLATYLGENQARTRPDHEFPELRTRAYPITEDKLSLASRQAIEDIGWSHDGTDDNTTLRAVAVTPWLGFKDDITIELESDSGQRTRVHIVSRSRVGRADFGANIRHIHEFYQALSARVSGYTFPEDP